MTAAHLAFTKLDGISLNKLHLDPLNPRHDPIDDEDKIIEELCKKEQVLNLAKDIVAKGALNPFDNIGVIEIDDNPGHYISVEGNRRACALKLLSDPHKAPNPEVRLAFEALAQHFTPPLTLSVVLFADRHAARPWIGLRHLGAQDGAGTRSWDASQKVRYSEGESPNQLALAVLDRAEDSGWIDTKQREQLAITTLTRYLASPVVRAALGLGDNRELKYTHEASEVDAAIRQFLADAMPRTDGSAPLVNSRSIKSTREAYARELGQRGISPRTLLPSPVLPPEPDTIPKQAQQRPRGKQSPDSRTYLIPSDFVISHNDKPLLRLRTELRHTPIDGHEFAVNYLLRAFLERVLVIYAKHSKVHQPNMTDHRLMQACVAALEKTGVLSSDLKSMRVAMSDENAAHSLHTLGAAVHANHLPSRKGLIAAWDNWETSLKLMLAQL